MKPTKARLVDESTPQDASPAEGSFANNIDTDPDYLERTPAPSLADRQFSFVVLLLLTGAAVYIAYITFRPFLTSLFLALVLTIAFLPLHAWIARRVRSADAAALVTEAMVVLFILVPLILISVKLLAEAAGFFSYLSQQQWGASAWSGHYHGLSEAVHRTAERVGISPEQLQAGIAARARALVIWLIALVTWAAQGILQQITTAILTLLILFFFLRDRERYNRAIVDMLPLSPPRVRQLEVALRESVIANFYGMFAVGVIEGLLTTIAFWATGLRAPLLWGAVATIFSFMPRLGPALVWIPGVIVLFVQGTWVKAIVLFVWGAAVISLADFIVRDRVAGGRVNVSKLLVLLSMFGGLRVFGAIGIIAGPVVLSLAVTLSRMVREEYGSLREARRLAT